MNSNNKTALGLIGLLFALALAVSSLSQPGSEAAEPTGQDWFEIRVNPSTGGDDSGDGGTGQPQDLNYYYVGQTFNGMVKINSAGTSAANVWIDYDPADVQLSNLNNGTYFSDWAGLSNQSGRFKSTGYNLPYAQSSGLGDFASFGVTLDKPSAVNYGFGSPFVLDINTGIIGDTTESNIVLDGNELLDSAEDFQFHVWADTIQPYANNFIPASGSIDVPVDSTIQFDLRDSLSGEGDDSGVGTGVNTSVPTASITLNDGGGAADVLPIANFVCSGIWGSDLCQTSINLPALTTFAGDTRRFEYATSYTVQVDGFEDFASDSQDAFGEPNGPNTMNTAVFNFTTEADSVLPSVINNIPVNGASNVALDAVIQFDAFDRRTYPSGISGSGVDLNNCTIDISATSFPLTTFSASDPEVTAVPVDYGYQFSVDLTTDFTSGEQVNVDVNCADLSGNIRNRNWFFTAIVIDGDGDGVIDNVDNCVSDFNPLQTDQDGDGIGDVCDTDTDGDGVLNIVDNCSSTPNADQLDLDSDGVGDACDVDWDGDSVNNASDNCPLESNPSQSDIDGDGLGDSCDSDQDGDTISNISDNCPLIPNTNQADFDADGIGDACEDDVDGDGIQDSDDNCPNDPNPTQADLDGDGVGDACESDTDGDGVVNVSDNCPLDANPSQADQDVDGIGDVCDNDQDGDGIANTSDNCPADSNATQADADSDSVGDACDTDIDGDSILNLIDNCIFVPNLDQLDADGDGIGDECDTDADDDGVLNTFDNCPLNANPAQEDLDLDGIGDSCDDDIDGDSVSNLLDNCILIPNPTQLDQDSDGIGDDCDNDVDGDTVDNSIDNCPLAPNPGQEDLDLDGLGDACESDLDGDGILNQDDNCPAIVNPLQEDLDADGVGDLCETDTDGDGILNQNDNCPLIQNAGQEDLDGDGIGDACDDDVDGDLIENALDNCLIESNPDQNDCDDDGIGDVCDEQSGSIAFALSAKPEKRATIDSVQDLSLDGRIQFYDPNTDQVVWEGNTVINPTGQGTCTTDAVVVGTYDVGLKGRTHLNAIIRGVSILGGDVALDYTDGGVSELTDGDLFEDDFVNSFDLSTLFIDYGAGGGQLGDFNKDGFVNAPDIGLLILNYFQQGEKY